MPRATTPSFVQEFEVRATSKDRSVLRSRLEAGRQLYNAVLGEALPGCQESGERREHLPKPRKPAPKEEPHVA